MEPVTSAGAFKILSRAFCRGLAGYKVRRQGGLSADEITTLEAFVGKSGELAGMLQAGGPAAPPRLLALHTALVMRAFGAACTEHWANNGRMAGALDKPSGWRLFTSAEEEDRLGKIETLLRRAVERLSTADKGTQEKTFDLLSAIVGDSLGSPWYQALWETFTSESPEDGEQPRLIDLDDPGARLRFERFYLLAYAEAVTSPLGAEVARGMMEIETARPRLLRELIAGGLSTWKRQHVFGEVETPGVPNMPLEEIYVEPDGVYVEQKDQRRPIRQLVLDLLRQHKVVVVRGDFGHGKSLTARMLACELAEAYLTGRTLSSPDLVYPLFIKCGVDFANHEPSLAKVVPRALRHQARALRIDLAMEDGALVPPPRTDRVVYLVDGLDEVALTSAEVGDFFKGLQDSTHERHRAVVFSRKGVLPHSEKLRGVPIVDLQHLRTEGEQPGGQVAEWLERWNRLSGKPPITVQQIEAKSLLGVVTTPIILFMAALTWDAQQKDGAPLTKAEIYERFFQQIAAGKCRQDQDLHQPVIEASRRLLASLVELKEVEPATSEENEPTARSLAMLWLMARIAWEGQRCARRNSELTLHEVTAILRDELGIRNDPKAEELIRIGVLLVLQADHHGGNDRILFGHKSFREFLVARYWASQLRRILATRHDKRGGIEKKLLGARLLNADDGTFEFLMEILDGPAWDAERDKLVEWASDCFNREAPEFEDPNAPTWQQDQRPVFREAALAIGSRVKGSEGLSAEHHLTLRTMLGWFWTANVRAIVVAPRLRAQGASLEDAFLERANLERANLERANLERANLHGANLQGADLQGAKLFRANLSEANLLGAFLGRANLRAASLREANLTEANLVQATLEGANLVQANLSEANLSDSGFAIL